MNVEVERDEASECLKWRDRAFAEFWRRYPRKRSRKRAKQKWDCLILTPELLGRILAGLDFYMDEWARDLQERPLDGLQFVPYPATWIFQERWTDADADDYARTCDEWVERYCFHVPTCAHASHCRAQWIEGR